MDIEIDAVRGLGKVRGGRIANTSYLVRKEDVIADGDRGCPAGEYWSSTGVIDPTQRVRKSENASAPASDHRHESPPCPPCFTEDGLAMNNLVLIFIDPGRYEEAIPALARAVTLGDDVPSFHNNLGIALEQVGCFFSAAEAYRFALLVDPAYEKASMNLARVELVREGPMSQPFDLDGVAQRFTQNLRSWNRDAVVER